MVLARGLALSLLLPLFLPGFVKAQEDPVSQEETGTIRLFMDCRASGCDMEYLRTEIQFVDHVRDIRDSDVYLLATSQRTGAGGVTAELIFTGRDRFQGMADTLTFVGGFDATPDETREGLTRLIKIGLMRFVGLTETAQKMEIGLRPPRPAGGPGRPPAAGGPTAREDDPWDFWVFNVRGSGSMNGRTNRRSRRFSGSFSASRVTEDWKVDLGVSSSYDDDRYDYPEADYYRLSVRRSHSFNSTLTKTVAARWSAGLRLSARNATYYNFDFSGTLAPVLEYSIFPYQEATRRSFTLQYAVEAAYHDYREQTIYFKDHESVLSHSLSAALGFNRPWGNAHGILSGGHHLDDVDKHHVSLFGSLTVRLGRGLSLSLSGSASRVKDLITVAAGADDTVEEILLSRRQFQTDYT